MNENNITILKKQIIYRCNYSGIKETDILYKKYIVDKIDYFSLQELKDINILFKEFSDNEIYQFLSKQKIPTKKFINLFRKIFNEK